jgi:thiol-disulfide isomerase/thioredoxin
VTAGLIVCAAVLAAATVFGAAWRRRDGVLRATRPAGLAGGSTGAGGATARRAVTLTPQQLGRPLGSRATLLQFSTAFCAPCRATRRVLGEVAAMVDGVEHVEIDAEAHLSLVRLLGILSTPAVFVLGPDGTIVRRGTGQPRKADVIAALGVAVPDAAAAPAAGSAGPPVGGPVRHPWGK